MNDLAYIARDLYATASPTLVVFAEHDLAAIAAACTRFGYSVLELASLDRSPRAVVEIRRVPFFDPYASWWRGGRVPRDLLAAYLEQSPWCEVETEPTEPTDRADVSSKNEAEQ